MKTSSTTDCRSQSTRRRAPQRLSLLTVIAAAGIGLSSTGCQIDVAGQTLPSPYYLQDDVQFYAPGPEFKLANEAAALAEQRAAQVSEPQR